MLSCVRGNKRSQNIMLGGATALNSYHTLVFDLDGTLYPANSPYIRHIRNNILTFLEVKNFVPAGMTASEVWRPLFQKYNQTRRGLKEGGYKFDDSEYWSFHRAGVEKFLSQDQNLRNNLNRFPQKKYIFTNCHEVQALEALECLGIKDCFDGVIGAGMMGDFCKPEEQAFQVLLDYLNKPNGSGIVFFEDSFKNLVTAKKLGFTTVLIESITAEEEDVTSEQRKSLDSIISDLSNAKCIEKLQEDIPSIGIVDNDA